MAQRTIQTTLEQDLAINYLGGDAEFNAVIQSVLEGFVNRANEQKLSKIEEILRNRDGLGAKKFLESLADAVR